MIVLQIEGCGAGNVAYSRSACERRWARPRTLHRHPGRAMRSIARGNPGTRGCSLRADGEPFAAHDEREGSAAGRCARRQSTRAGRKWTLDSRATGARNGKNITREQTGTFSFTNGCVPFCSFRIDSGRNCMTSRVSPERKMAEHPVNIGEHPKENIVFFALRSFVPCPGGNIFEYPTFRCAPILAATAMADRNRVGSRPDRG